MKPLPKRAEAVLEAAVSVRAEAATSEAAGVAAEAVFRPRITAGLPGSRKSLAGSLSLVNSKSPEPGGPGSSVRS